MKKAFFLCVMSLLFAAFSQEAEAILRSLAVDAFMTGRFVQTKSDGKSGKSLRSSGDFIVSRDGICFITREPYKSALSMTRDAVNFFDAHGKKRKGSSSGGKGFASSAAVFVPLFSGDVDEVAKRFSIGCVAGEKSWEIRLSPEDSTVATVVSSISMRGGFDGGIARLDAIEIVDARSPGSTLYEFFEQNAKTELSSDEKSYFAAD